MDCKPQQKYLLMCVSAQVCIFYYFFLTLHPQRCQLTDAVLSLLQRSLQASTLHFPGCRRAGQGQGCALFAGLMKHVYLSVCAFWEVWRVRDECLLYTMCVRVCIMCFQVQDGTPTSQRLIHHSVAEWQSDIYGCLIQLCVCVRGRCEK